MKCLLVLLSLAALTWAQDSFDCECSAFVSLGDSEVPVLDFPTTTIDDCTTDYTICYERCANEWQLFTGDGTLNVPGPDGVLVGQHMCDTLKTHGYTELGAHVVYLYYHVCDAGPWIFTGQYSHSSLCCTNGNYYDC
ncbi:uncharacterized protein [Procambarus clarkii]|uniref:uncharacterized protein isoform X2 n=1 Tax=Procambarus clarkii TaxID=6728 RepID=UPI003743FC0F